ncbi:unnamed protein product [Boreogadus saida]
MACSSEDTCGSNIANWQYRDPRTLSPLSSPAKNYSASNIEDSESQIPEGGGWWRACTASTHVAGTGSTLQLVLISWMGNTRREERVEGLKESRGHNGRRRPTDKGEGGVQPNDGYEARGDPSPETLVHCLTYPVVNKRRVRLYTRLDVFTYRDNQPPSQPGCHNVNEAHNRK